MWEQADMAEQQREWAGTGTMAMSQQEWDWMSSYIRGAHSWGAYEQYAQTMWS